MCLNHQKTKTIQKKLLSDKQIKFKELCMSWNKKFIKICPEIALKYLFEKMWFYMKYIVKNRRWRILKSWRFQSLAETLINNDWFYSRKYHIIIDKNKEKHCIEQNRTEQNVYWSEIHIQRIVTKTTHEIQNKETVNYWWIFIFLISLWCNLYICLLFCLSLHVTYDA